LPPVDRLVTDFVLSVNKELYMTTRNYINCTSSTVGQDVTHLTIHSTYWLCSRNRGFLHIC